MELKGEYRIPAPREQVWAMLNDPAVLRECIPGCESLEGNPAEGFAARVTTKVGPVKATFNGAGDALQRQAARKLHDLRRGQGRRRRLRQGRRRRASRARTARTRC